MPFAQIYMIAGRTDEQKKAVIQKVTQALQDALGAPRENVRVWIHEIANTQWGIGGTPASELNR